ncbi:MAG: DNA primase [Deltaproteobacteria bacterium]|nr:DNA primase [Deltaproteobacteria bacterium]
MIPEEVIAEIKRRADIGAVIGRSVKLKKSGRNLTGLCPFHSEKTPSFNVRPDEGFFYCFGCKAAGDVVEFVVRSSGRGFLDVLTELAAETGVVLPQLQLSSEETAAQKEKKRLLHVCELAQVFFRTRLIGDEGRGARAYLKDVRKLDERTIDDFGLGFGSVGDRGLRDFLVAQGLSIDDGVAAGVLGRGERGDYDFFRHRITIPIRNQRGEVTSFGGRIFGEGSEGRPKYLNGPQSAVYDKSNTLYGLYEAQAALKQGKPAVLVEGYFDVIAVQRAGLPTAVAPCGTSLTPRHVEELKRRVERSRVILCLDADKAGKEASDKAIKMLLSAGVEVGLVLLPDKDPDQMVNAGNAELLNRMILDAPSALDALVKDAQLSNTKPQHIKKIAIDRVAGFVAVATNPIIRDTAITQMETAFSMAPNKFREYIEDGRYRDVSPSAPRLDRLAERSANKPAAAAQQQQPPATTTTNWAASARPRAAAPKRPAFNDVEVQLAKIVLCHPELAPRVALFMPHLESVELKRFVSAVVDGLVRFHDVAPREVLPRIAVSPSGHLIAMADRVRLDGPDRTLGLTTALSMVEAFSADFLERHQLEARLGAVQPALARADEAQDHSERKRLLNEQKAIVAALQALDAPPVQKPLRASVARVVDALPAHVPSEAPHAFAAQLQSPPSISLVPPLQTTTTTTTTTTEPASPSSMAPRSAPDSMLPDEPPWAGDPEDDPWAV